MNYFSAKRVITMINVRTRKLAGNAHGVTKYPKLFAMPALLIYSVFFVLPILAGFYYSFTNWSMFSDEIKFIGLKQFAEVLKNPELAIATKNTVVFTVVSAVVKNILAFGLAIALTSGIRSKNVLRAVFYAPAILNIVATGLIFQAILNPSTGFLNLTLRKIGLDSLALGWIADPKLSIYSAVIMEVWRATGISMSIYVAGIQRIPRDCLEAATIDGANAIQKFFRVTLPLCMQSITINFMLTIIYGLRMFTIIFFLTKGGPGNSSEVIMTLAYKYMCAGFNGYSSAFNMLLVVAIILISIPLLIMLTKKEVEY